MGNKGFLLVLMQPPPAFEDEFNAWYDTEHVPERVAVEGFESGRRYVCIDGHPKYLAMYDMVNEAVLETESYLRVSADRASPWTRRVTSRVKVYRSAGEQIFPGDEVTVPSVRTLLLRFSGVPAGLGEAVIAGAKASFAGKPGTVQLRVFAYPRGRRRLSGDGRAGCAPAGRPGRVGLRRGGTLFRHGEQLRALLIAPSRTEDRPAHALAGSSFGRSSWKGG
ncbi:hypothetical protein ACFSKM_15735 [Ancylobacter dichloromethanicus]